jgi:hypothetical protein
MGDGRFSLALPIEETAFFRASIRTSLTAHGKICIIGASARHLIKLKCGAILVFSTGHEFTAVGYRTHLMTVDISILRGIAHDFAVGGKAFISKF